MARFLISPGVKIREIDQSQYPSTTPGAGNIAALIGYTEKGPFEPTLVYGITDFVQKFGKTIKDVPYLAQAAYKYFEEGDTVLVVRAGDDRDPDTYSSAAQYASKSIRINPNDILATGGYQAFSFTGASVVDFTQGATYGFRLLTDYRAFEEAKTVEKFTGAMAEIYSDAGTAPYTFKEKPILKLAYSPTAPNSFTIHLKANDISERGGSINYTSWYQGTGTRSGNEAQGETFNAALSLYDTAGPAYDEMISLSGIYGAVILGSANLFGGYAGWGTIAEQFVITLGTTAYTVELDTACANISEVITHINEQLVIADNGGTPTDITNKVQAIKYEINDTTAYVALKHIDDEDEGFTIAAGTSSALATLGWTAQVYNDNEWISGSFNSTIDSSSSSSGLFVFNICSTDTNVYSFEEQMDVAITAPSSTSWTKTEIIAAINAQLAAAYYPTPITVDGSMDTTVDKETDPGIAIDAPDPRSARGRAILDTDGKIRIIAGNLGNNGTFTPISSTEGNISRVRITSADSTGGTLVSLLGGIHSAVDGVVAQDIDQTVITLKAAEKGSYGNNLIFRTETETVSSGITTFTNKNVYVLLNGKEVSVYLKVNWTDPSADNYILTKMANDPYLEIEAVDEDDNDILSELPDGDWILGDGNLPDTVTETQAEIVDFNVGTNGWTEAGGIITSMSADFINALTKIANPEVYEFNLVAAPGDASPIVQNGVQSLCDSRRDCFGVVDGAPFGLGLGIANSTNSIDEVNTACSTVTSSYVGVFWSWLQDYDSDNQQYVWLPPSIYALKAMVYTDNTADPWYAPAGTRRGRVTALDVEYSPTRVERDVLYGSGKVVNPIVKFINEGILIWGQKTAQRTNSATDRINVRRLLIYAEKLIARMALGFLFEPNDPANWAAFARQANAILEPIRQRRGLYTYSVVCDSTTNTDALINQNIMAGKIFVQPTKTTEFIEVEFTINAASGETTITE